MIITCPSGLAGEVRALKVRELQQLGDASLARGGRNLDIMLGMMTAITDPGPYPWEVGARPNWDAVLSGDRFAALIDIRCATWGADYEFTIPCAECGEPIPWELDLRELPRTAFPAETLAQLTDGGKNEFSCAGPAGEIVRFKLLNGADEKAIDAHRRQNNGRFGIGDGLVRKILGVDELKDAKVREWIYDLDAQPARALLERMQLVEGGVETDIEIVCKDVGCMWRQWVSLPFGRAFYVPPKKRPVRAIAQEAGSTAAPAPQAAAATTAGATSHGHAKGASTSPARKTG